MGEIPGQKWGGRGAWGRAAILASFPSQRAGAAPWVLLDGRDLRKGVGERGLEKVGPRKKRYLLSRPGGKGVLTAGGRLGGGAHPGERETGCAGVCTWVPVRGHVRVSARAGVGLALLRVSTAG